MADRQDRRDELTERIIGCAFDVSNGLGTGFLEKVYETALVYELAERSIAVERQKSIEVFYKGVIVGKYVADLVVEKDILVELKAVKSLDTSHVAQCLNYLKATGLPLCLLLNFGNSRVEVKRFVN